MKKYASSYYPAARTVDEDDKEFNRFWLGFLIALPFIIAFCIFVNIAFNHGCTVAMLVGFHRVCSLQ